MKIHVFTTHSEIDDGFPARKRASSVRDDPVVVIDVLRTSSSMLQALVNGCKEIIPVESVERALALHSALFDSDILLCGEREGVKIYGFDLGNSPLEYTREKVAHKSLIFTSTNGSVTLVKLRKCKTVYLCGFQNIDTVAIKVTPKGSDRDTAEQERLDIICSGQNNKFALEDIICAGMLIMRVIERYEGPAELSDSARSALQLYKHNARDLKMMIQQADHGRELIKLGMEKDLDFCIQVDTIPMLPVFADGKILLSAPQ